MNINHLQILSRKFLALILLGTASVSTFAQEAVLSACGDISASYGSVTYSIGQIAYITHSGSDGTITEGVQQPFEIIYIPGPGIDEANGGDIKFLVFPNPAASLLTLKTESQNKHDLKYQLFDAYGKLLQSSDIEAKETILPMGDLPPATYLLTITDDKITIKTIKIIKK